MSKSFLRTMCIAGALLAVGHTASAQAAYPDRPVRLVVPYAAGGPTDTFARALAETWSKELGVTMIVDNRSGAGTVVGTEAVAKAASDGYTVLLTTVALAVNPAIHATLPYDAKTDLAPVGLAARAPLVLIVNKNVPVQTLPEFIDYLEKRPGKVNFGSAGIGSAPHLGGALLNYMGKLDAVHVPYRGSAPAIADLLGGHVEFMIDSAPTALAQVNAGTVRILGTTMEKRLPQTPDTPAIAEAIPGYEAYTWNAAFVPANTPDEAVQKLNSTLAQALQNENLQKKAYDMGLLLEESPTPEALSAFVEAELTKWSVVAKASNMSTN